MTHSSQEGAGLSDEELAEFMRDPGDAWENTKRPTNEWLASIAATIRAVMGQRDGAIALRQSDTVTWQGLLAAAEADNARLREASLWMEQVCLVCGGKAPCMAEKDLKPDDPGTPCTFDAECIKRAFLNGVMQGKAVSTPPARSDTGEK